MVRPNAEVDNWAGSFSNFPLCAEPTDAEVSIVGVKPQEVVGSVQDFRVAVATPVPDRPPRGGMFIGVVGRAPAFVESYADNDSERYGRYLTDRYRFQDLAKPVAIDASCGSPEFEPQLMFSFETDRTGGIVRSWEVIYESDGIRYTSGPVNFEAGLCGNHSSLAEHCAGTRGVPAGAE